MLMPELAFDSSFLNSLNNLISLREKELCSLSAWYLEAHSADFFEAVRRSDTPLDDTFHEITELFVVAFERFPFALG